MYRLLVLVLLAVAPLAAQISFNQIRATSRTYANLGTPANGAFVYCSNCKPTSAADNTCTSGGTGSLAIRLSGTWRCPGSAEVASLITAALGGTGDDTSATTGVPRIASGNWTYDAAASHLSGWPSGVDMTEVGYLNGVTSAIQTQIDTHTALTNPHSATASATASRIALRDAGGRTAFAAATSADDAVTLGSVVIAEGNFVIGDASGRAIGSSTALSTVTDHLASTANPHAVTADQVSAWKTSTYSDVTQIAAPGSNPAEGVSRTYMKTNGAFCWLLNSGVEQCFGGTGTTIFTLVDSDGSNFRKFTVPDTLSADLTYRYPNSLPAGSILKWATASGGISDGTHVALTATPTADAAVQANGSGKLDAGWLPNPSASTLGGVQSKTCSAGDFVSQIDTSGVPQCTTPGGGSTTKPLFGGNGGGDSVNASSGEFLGNGQSTFGSSARSWIMGGAATVTYFAMLTQTAQGAAGSLVCTLQKNGVDTALVLTWAAGAAASTQAATGSVSYAQGDTMVISCVNGHDGPSAQVRNWGVGGY